MNRFALWCAISSLGIGLFGMAAVAFGSEHDVRAALRLYVGFPTDPAPMTGLNPHRTGQAKAQLPTRLKRLWQQRFTGNIEQSLAADAAGHIVVVHGSNRVSQLNERGTLEWSRELSASVGAAPVLLSGGTRVILELGGNATGFGRKGNLVFSTKVPAAPLARPVAPLVLDNGGLVVSYGEGLYELHESGRIQSNARLDRVSALLGKVDGTLVIVNEAGVVHTWRAPLDPATVGSLGGNPNGSCIIVGRELFAIVERDRLTALDLETGKRRTVAEIDAAPRSAMVVSSKHNTPTLLSLFTRDEALVGIDPGGAERYRINTAAARTAPRAAWETPLLLSDREGTLATVTSTGIATRLSNGTTSVGETLDCDSPIALVPAFAQRLAFVCGAGWVALFAQAQ